MRQIAFLHDISARPGSALAATLAEDSRSVGSQPGFLDGRPVVRVSGEPQLLERAAAGLPRGAATAEALAARLHLAGVELGWGRPERVADAAELVALTHARGRASVDVVRVEPSLLPTLQVGGWFAASSGYRTARRNALALGSLPHLARLAARRPRALKVALDLAFWSGVRAAATPAEWRRLTESSYVVLYYHRIAGEAKPGQERLDLGPAQFDAQMRLLRLLRFRPLSADEIVAFHADPSAALPRRACVVTADDGFLDCAVAFRRHLDRRPHLFVATEAVGKTAWWVDGEPLAGWDELRALSAGGAEVGSHTRRHASLPELAPGELDDELAESLRELRARLPRPAPLLAYPHGRNDPDVRAATARAGYRAAFTTHPGRNGAGTDPYALRRIGVKTWDSSLSFLWKVVTGDHLPRAWDARRRRARAGHRLRRPHA